MSTEELNVTDTAEDKDSVVDFFENTEEEKEVVHSAKPLPPRESTKEWYDFLIDNLHENELINGHPTTDGLRRFTQEFYGDIIYSEPIDPHIIQDVHGSRAVCTHRIKVIKYSTGQEVTVAASVDVHEKNIQYPFNMHLLATADTKSEGKALRRLLKVKIVTHEEVQAESGGDLNISSDKERINDQQLLAINAICKKYDIDVVKAVSSLIGDKNLKSITHAEACNLIDKITSLQREDSIPEEILGYNKSWSNT